VAEENSRADLKGMRILLINAFEKLPAENFRDQRYTFIYELLKQRTQINWFSSDFHHWSHSRRDANKLPPEDRENIKLIRTISYRKNVGLRRLISYFALSAATAWNLFRLKQRPHVIVCMGPPEQMFLVTLYGKLRGVPIIIDVIDPWPDVYLKAFPNELRLLGKAVLFPYFAMSRITFTLCTFAMAVSETYLAWAIRRGHRKDLESFACFYLGARNDDFDVSKVPEPRGAVSCLFAGQFGFSYDIDLILEAAHALPDFHFVLCGAGGKHAEVVRRASALRNVEVHGWLSPTELNRVGSACQIGLCAYSRSATQSVPTKLFDYFSMGLYVLSSLAGEAEAMLRSHGVGRTYRAGSLESFVNCLQGIRDECDLTRDGRAAIRRKFDQHFSAGAIYPRMVDEVILPIAGRVRASRRDED
jgi:hypothetical protein